MSKVIGVVIDGELSWHAQGVLSDYDTLCGVDANDPTIGHGGTVTPRRGQKIDCQNCKTMWLNMQALRLRAKNFE